MVSGSRIGISRNNSEFQRSDHTNEFDNSSGARISADCDFQFRREPMAEGSARLGLGTKDLNSLLLLHPQLPKQERIYVGEFFNLLGHRFPRAMPRLRFDP